MTNLVAISTLDSARTYVMLGAFFTQRMISSISVGGSINLEGFLSSMLLLVVIIVMVVFVVVIWVVIFVNVIVGVIIVVVFGIVVVGGGVSSIFNLSFVIVDSFSCYWSSACPGVFVSIMLMYENNSLVLKDTTESFRIQDRYGNNGMSNPSAQLLRENTNSVRSTQRLRSTAPSIPLK
ncbi:hypothetical protein Tco_0853728 [Tanacetum coccineum]